MLQAGLDIGSTTVKLVIMKENEIVFSKYKRHYSDIKSATLNMLTHLPRLFDKKRPISFILTGSAGIGIAELTGLSFIQEVIASTHAVEVNIPDADTIIELGGEDSKVTFLTDGVEQRMNGTCAGGTGAFIDQMAELLATDASGINTLSKSAAIHYPIASRCGVFAKTDVQPLLNQGASKSDIAASILQAVVNQTITSLSSGRKIKGRVVFLGGPLYFLDELRQKFINTLQLSPENVIFPKNALFYVALGAALYPKNRTEISINELINRLETGQNEIHNQSIAIEPLFENEIAYSLFKKRHDATNVSCYSLSDASGPLFVGIDAGSTTTKLILLDQDDKIYFQYYAQNNGEPLDSVIAVLKEVYQNLPKKAFLAKVTVTGYGEELIKKAIHADIGIVETMAHYEGANHFYPGVDFILDIGGQDMKAMSVRDGSLTAIQLNEACSSGCGSFIDTFARTLNYSIADFANAALFSKNPADLGSKCTVFMNSKVKQVQKEGFEVGDISAGLAISVIKNALYKVIKVRDAKNLGEKIVVQGGTFLNDAVLRAFETLLGKEVVRPSIAGSMGAYGAALIAKKQYNKGEISQVLGFKELNDFTATKTFDRCRLCENNCQLTITYFGDGSKLISGNRCERGANIRLSEDEKRVDLSDYRYRRLFGYRPLSKKKATRGVIGIPRALNIYEHYPLWHTIFTQLGFRVVLSPLSKKEIYESGMDTIPSDTVCYPAKISHGHVQSLIDKNITEIFFPTVVYERNEFKEASNFLNCVVAQGYPNLIFHNIDDLQNEAIHYHTPTVDLSNASSIISALVESFSTFAFEQSELEKAVSAGLEEMSNFREDIKKQGEILLERIVDKNEPAIVLAGRPYHTDPEINHGIAKVATSLGFHVLTEDSICHLGDVSNLRAVNVWEYSSRLFAAAKVTRHIKQLEFVQLNSFGCGIDAISADQINELLEPYGKIVTTLKIDEGSNLGAVRIRLRSLKASYDEKNRSKIAIKTILTKNQMAPFTTDLKQKHTLLIPAFGAPIRQYGLTDIAYDEAGYSLEILPQHNVKALDAGLRFVNNEVCHPLIDYVGQIVNALDSGQYDLENTSIMMFDPGSDCSCRGANIMSLLEKALVDAGYGFIPLLKQPFMYNKFAQDEKENGILLTESLVRSLSLASTYADLFERVVFRTRPYEIQKGAVNQLLAKWLKMIEPNIRNGSFELFQTNITQIIREFDELPLRDEQKPVVGIVGDYGLTINYSENAKDVAELLEEEGVEVVIPGFGYMSTFSIQTLKEEKWQRLAKNFHESCELPLNDLLINSDRFRGFYSIFDMEKEADNVAPFASYKEDNFGFIMGGKIYELLKDGVDDIVLYQAFNCSPNYVTGVGLIKNAKKRFPGANIVNIDYDPGMSTVNTVNRIRLMLATAEKKLLQKT